MRKEGARERLREGAREGGSEGARERRIRELPVFSVKSVVKSVFGIR